MQYKTHFCIYSTIAYSTFGEGTGTIWIDDVLCKGSEEALSQCLHSGWGVHNCRHSEDASVVCSSEYIMQQLYCTILQN